MKAFISAQVWYSVGLHGHSLKMTTIERLYRPKEGDTVLDLGCGSGVVSNFLAETGATVYGLDSNPQAIEFARSNEAPDAAVLDYNMPEMNGAALSKQLKDLWPGTRILLLTGGGFDVGGDIQEEGVEKILYKPVSAASLLEVLFTPPGKRAPSHTD